MARARPGLASVTLAALLADLPHVARADEARSVPSDQGERSPPNAWAFRGNGPVEFTWSHQSLAAGAEALQFGFGADGHIAVFVGPVSIHGEAGLGFTPALTCEDDGEDGCGMYGRIRIAAAIGPALAVEDRTRLFLRAGAAAGLEGHPAYGLAELYAPRFELGFAKWRPIGAAPTLKDTQALIFTDVALTGSVLVGAAAGTAVEEAPMNGTLGAAIFTVLGPASLELRIDASPDRTWLIGRSRLCAGVFGIACASIESVHAHVVDQNDGRERDMNGTSVQVAFGGGGAFALE